MKALVFLIVFIVVCFSTPVLAMDADNDGLADTEEETLGTDPSNPDSDGDGILDGDEALGDPATDPNDRDTDQDGAPDGIERSRGTDPTDADSDDDGVSDGEEIASGTNPLDRTEPLRFPDSEISGGTCSTFFAGGPTSVWPLILALLGAFRIRRRL